MSREALDMVVEQLGDKVLHTHSFRGDETVVLERSVIVQACLWLRDHETLRFNMLTDLTAVDHLPRVPRFEVVYQLYSVPRRHRLRLKVQVPEEEAVVQSCCKVWPIANWLEREVWDMYGIRFSGHPDLRRILLYEQFQGHPLRKDYPKEKRQPLARRPEGEIAEVLTHRWQARPLDQLIYQSKTLQD